MFKSYNAYIKCRGRLKTNVLRNYDPIPLMKRNECIGGLRICTLWKMNGIFVGGVFI